MKIQTVALICVIFIAGPIAAQDSLIGEPQCITNDDCRETLTCIRLKCADPCLNLCTGNSNCQVRNHVPYCSCKPGFVGDPFTGCNQQVSTSQVQCVTNDDCARDRTCIKQKCDNPCSGICNVNSICEVRDHVPYCSCKHGFYGDPFTKCSEQYPPGSWPPFPGAKKRYKVEAVKTNWFSAFAQCLRHGGRLASIMSKEENEQAVAAIVRSGLRGQFWASGTDYALETHWTWMGTGRPFTFTDWTDNQPDNWQNKPGGEHCLELWDTGSYKWNDRNCLDVQYSICEYYDHQDHYDVEWRKN